MDLISKAIYHKAVPGVVLVIEGAGLRTRRAARELIDGASRAIGAEPRRRHCHAVRSAPVSFVRLGSTHNYGTTTISR
jgi:hypothetical protein